MGNKATVRTAFFGPGFALIPEPGDPQLFRRVEPKVLFTDCAKCGALAGQACRDQNGSPMTLSHHRGSSNRTRYMSYEDRLAMAAGLIAAGRFDRVEILRSTATLRGDDGQCVPPDFEGGAF